MKVTLVVGAFSERQMKKTEPRVHEQSTETYRRGRIPSQVQSFRDVPSGIGAHRCTKKKYDQCRGILHESRIRVKKSNHTGSHVHGLNLSALRDQPLLSANGVTESLQLSGGREDFFPNNGIGHESPAG
jgi:hypothetical protein